jgi:GNAT superfamily N-acetyltransferase
MSARPLALSQARNADVPTIAGLIQEAANWLRTKDTDQWARPWPDQAGLENRIKASIRLRTTWICWHDATPAATITADPREDPYWSDVHRGEPAVYVHRLVVSRKYAGEGLGAALLDWAGDTARREHGAAWIRVSAWTTNRSLHDYYRRQGFFFIGFHADGSYPSGARFEKPTVGIPPAGSSDALSINAPRTPDSCE